MFKYILIICFCYDVVKSVEIINPSQVRNDETNVLYNEVLVMPLIKRLEDFVGGKRDPRITYLPDDVALVQAIISLQETLFQLAAFYGAHEQGLQHSQFNGGLGIEFQSQRCDQVYSSKFPRHKLKTTPWKFYRDTSYYHIDCEGERHRRNVGEPLSQSVEKSRETRAVRHDPSCGVSLLKSASGSLKYPMKTGNYSTNVVCQWVIQVPHQFAAEVRVNKLHTEKDKLCLFDSLNLYNGDSDKAPLLARLCGNESERIFYKSDKSFFTIKFISDEAVVGEGFMLNWTITKKKAEHPGFVITSTMGIDQVGDLNVDTFNFDSLPVGEKLEYKAEEKFKLRLTKPTTCQLDSDDIHCYFETQPYIISKIISTGTHPHYHVPEDSIEIVFDHVVQTDLYPDLYHSPKFCLTWDSGVKNTAYGSWSRNYGKVSHTNLARTICKFSRHGVHAVAVVVPPEPVPDAFRFTRSWYFGLVFSVIWIFITFLKLSMTPMNIPDWLNFNQLLALLVFCGIILSGIHLEFNKFICSVMSFLLYYFGLSVFVWHLLKAAQFTGAFDKFFRIKGSLYLLYLIIGWGSPFFLAGMAGGAKLYIREKKQSCWMALKGGVIWGYTTPTYFIVLAILFLYFKGLRKTKYRMETFNYPKLRIRAVRDFVALMLFLITWLTGIICILQPYDFAPQYFFCISLCLTVLVLCLGAKQVRRSFEKEFDWEDFSNVKKVNDVLDEDIDEEDNTELELARKYFNRWKFQPEPQNLGLALFVRTLEDAVVIKKGSKYEIDDNLKVEDQWNNMYQAEVNFAYEEDGVDENENKNDEENKSLKNDDASNDEDDSSDDDDHSEVEKEEENKEEMKQEDVASEDEENNDDDDADENDDDEEDANDSDSDGDDDDKSKDNVSVDQVETVENEIKIVENNIMEEENTIKQEENNIKQEENNINEEENVTNKEENINNEEENNTKGEDKVERRAYLCTINEKYI